MPARVATLKRAKASEQGSHVSFFFLEHHRTDSFSLPALRRPLAQNLRWFVVGDALALGLGFLCAWGLAFVVNQIIYERAVPNLLSGEDTLNLIPFSVIALGILFWFEHTNHYRIRLPFWIETQKICTSFGFALLVDGFLHFASKQDFSRVWMMSCWGFAALGTLAFRALLRLFLKHRGVWTIRSLLVGDGATAEDTRLALQSEPALGYEIVAQLDDFLPLFQKLGHSWARLCAFYGADHVVVALEGEALARAEPALAQMMREDISFAVSPPLRPLPVLGMEPQVFFTHDVALMTRTNRLEQPLSRLIKRSFDLIGASLLLLVSAPILALIALRIKADGGAILFRQKRIGMKGKVFDCLKFRSMIRNSDELLARYLTQHPDLIHEWNSHRKLRGEDPRVTLWGRFLRRWSLDELPQFWNVLRGDMSLVGPRPIMLGEAQSYGADIAHYHRVRPGITGTWQVNGRNEVSYLRRVQLDSWYVRHWSLWNDMVILCKTIPVVLQRKGAY